MASFKCKPHAPNRVYFWIRSIAGKSWAVGYSIITRPVTIVYADKQSYGSVI